ncbi:MAG TPA: zinc-ribbon domain-containing protein, partial [Myxococcota bacterium]|nr:zinc-ribbon domain-containing protein [Myxococcota bacterium]
MIVRCERCETRFKLDESRLPARGARVRCSRCKHAFFVTPPGAAKEEIVHEVAAAAARAPAPKARPPEPSWDLEEGNDATLARRKAAAASARAESEDEATDWRFEEDVPGLDPGATRSSFDLSGSQTAPSLAAPPDPDDNSFAGLGDPETWDLLSGDAPPPDEAHAAPPLEPALELAPPPAPPARAAVPARTVEPAAPEAAPPAP